MIKPNNLHILSFRLYGETDANCSYLDNRAKFARRYNLAFALLLRYAEDGESDRQSVLNSPTEAIP